MPASTPNSYDLPCRRYSATTSSAERTLSIRDNLLGQSRHTKSGSTPRPPSPFQERKVKRRGPQTVERLMDEIRRSRLGPAARHPLWQPECLPQRPHA